ncbi:MAG TPA: spore maturation protein [Firmicutes bacterium]|nr:spore maturation protein [Bacillota bacterium]
MINNIWLFLIAVGGMAGLVAGKGGVLTQSSLSAVQSAVNLTLNLVGVMALWSGVMKIAEESGLATMIARAVRPLVKGIFPSLPRDHPAISTITLSVVANLLGMGNAATPIGLKAMEDLQKLNRNPSTATDAMCTFIALTLTGIVLAPTTVIAIRAQYGSKDPTNVVGPIILLTTGIMIITLILDMLLRDLSRGR